MTEHTTPAPASTRRAHLVDRFVHELVVAILNLGMHAPDSQLVRESLRDVTSTLTDVLGDDGQLRLLLAGEHLRDGERDLVAASLQAGLLLGLCRRADVQALSFDAALSAEECGRFLRLLLEAPEREVIASAPSRHGVRHVRVEFSAASSTAPSSLPPSSPASEPSLRGYRELTSFLHDNHVAAFRGDDLQVDRAQGVVEQAISHLQQEPSGLLTLAAYDDIDSFTVGHSVRVALLALHVARAAQVTQADLVTIGTAALLHDVGKSRVPQEILCKRGRLDDEEWRIMTQHPRLGAEILLEQRHLDPRAIGAAFCHHMTPHGGGYPTPALAFAPSEVSKLVRVCDVFEALTAVRPYKRALTPVQAYAVMFKNARDFDSRWLRFFARTIGLYPLGTRVLLNTGVEACVVAHGSDPERPVVRVGGEAVAAMQAASGCKLEVGATVDGQTIEVAAVLGAGADRAQALAALHTMQCGVTRHPNCAL